MFVSVAQEQQPDQKIKGLVIPLYVYLLTFNVLSQAVGLSLCRSFFEMYLKRAPRVLVF